MAYTVLARRYRSQTFDDVCGQDAIAQTLRNAIVTGRVAHAYLFCGTRGVGKTTMARILAKGLNCLNSDEPTAEPCCECDSCLAVNTGEDIDVIEIDGASNNGVDSIRELRNNAIFRPARGRYKIYIIDEIHMLSTGAFNALLKILEEPPAHVKFIFATTEPNKVLPTIQSRCQRFDFKAIDAATIGKQLKSVLDSEDYKYDEDFITAVSRLANGSMRDALSLLDRVISSASDKLTLELLETTLGQPGRSRIASLLRNIASKDPSKVLSIADELLTEGMSCLQIADALVDYMRDVMVVSTSGTDNRFIILTSDEKKTVSELASMFDIASLIYGVTAFERMRGIIKNSENSRAILEASLVRLTLSEHFISVQYLMQKLGGASPVKKNFNKQPIAPSRVSQEPEKALNANKQQNQTEEGEHLPSIKCADLEEFKANWVKIVDGLATCEPMLASCLKHASPINLDNDNLTIKVNGISKKLFADNNRTDKLSSIISKITGEPVNIRFETKKDDNSAPAKPKGAKTSSKQRQEVLNNKDVQLILKAFNANVVDIATAEQ